MSSPLTIPTSAIETLKRDSWISLDRTTLSKRLSAELSLDGSREEAMPRVDEEEDQQETSQPLEVPSSDIVQRPKRGVMNGWTAEKLAASIYDKNQSSNSWVVPSKVRDIPQFATSEVRTGNVLGSGCFGSVWEVKGFDLHGEEGATNTKKFRFGLLKQKSKSKQQEEEPDTKTNKNNKYRDVEVDPGEIESRNFIAKHCYRTNGDARYALKRLKATTLENETGFINGMNDLATETLFLSALRNHPNVIKLRGVAMESMFSKGYFLILDRLYDTLKVRILKWRKKRKRAAGLVGPVFREKRRAVKNQIMEEQMKYGMDLAAAIAYIHDHRIMHRDIKPDNIGFDVRNDIKIFDFGLAKEMPPPETDSLDETFHLTAAGSPRYMAPEVALGEPYNQACDIYSFALVFWEMLHMQRPYAKQETVDLLEETVWSPTGSQLRPEISPKLPLNVHKIFHQAWSGNHQLRPRASQLLNALKQECLKIRQSMRVSHTARRSTFILGKEQDQSEQEYTMRSLESSHHHHSLINLEFDMDNDGSDHTW